MPRFPEDFATILPQTEQESAPQPESQMEHREQREDVSQFKERERSALERIARRTKKWVPAAALVLATTVIELVERFSPETHLDTKAHATEMIRTTEKSPETKVTLEPKTAEKIEVTSTGDDDVQKRYKEYLQKVKSDPTEFLLWMDEIKQEPFAMELAHAALRIDPFLFVGHWDSVQASFENPGALAETILKADPSILLTSDNKTIEFFTRVLKQSKDARLKLTLEISHQDLSDGDKTKLMALIPLLDSGRLTIEQATSLLGNRSEYVKALRDLLSTGEEFAAVTFKQELQNAFSQDIFQMNDQHNDPDAKRFESIQSYNAQELYALLVSDAGDAKNDAEPLAYPSTYQGVFDRLLERMKQENVSGTDLLVEVGSYRVEGFVRMAVERGRFDDFLSTMDFDEQTALIQSMVGDISTKPDVSTPTGIVADVLKQTRNGELKQVIVDEIKERFLATSAEDKEVRRAYGLLSVLAEPHASWIPQNEWAEYALPDQSQLETKELESSNGVVVERYFFYDDEDGATSYRNFLNSFKEKSGWKVVQKSGYVIVSSTGKGRSVKIYANEPSTGPNEENPDRQDAVEKVFEDEGIEPTVVVHRGHVYHQDSTLDRLPASTKLLVLGSCGGFAKVDDIMTDHPGVQVLSTKGTGTKLVNDTFLRAFEREVQTKDRVVWKDLWSDLSKKLGENIDFQSYVPPNENFHPLVAAKIRTNKV